MDPKMLNLLYQLQEVQEQHKIILDVRALSEVLPEGDDKATLTAALDDLEKNLAVDPVKLAAKFKYVVPPKPIKPVLAAVVAPASEPVPDPAPASAPDPAPAAESSYLAGLKKRVFETE
jgi:hypothetical protein